MMFKEEDRARYGKMKGERKQDKEEGKKKRMVFEDLRENKIRKRRKEVKLEVVRIKCGEEKRAGYGQ